MVWSGYWTVSFKVLPSLDWWPLHTANTSGILDFYPVLIRAAPRFSSRMEPIKVSLTLCCLGLSRYCTSLLVAVNKKQMWNILCLKLSDPERPGLTQIILKNWNLPLWAPWAPCPHSGITPSPLQQTQTETLRTVKHLYANYELRCSLIFEKQQKKFDSPSFSSVSISIFPLKQLPSTKEKFSILPQELKYSLEIKHLGSVMLHLLGTFPRPGCVIQKG